jgi:hypothetical protein
VFDGDAFGKFDRLDCIPFIIAERELSQNQTLR